MASRGTLPQIIYGHQASVCNYRTGSKFALPWRGVAVKIDNFVVWLHHQINSKMRDLNQESISNLFFHFSLLIKFLTLILQTFLTPTITTHY